jgi:hypothetical protein
MCPVRVEDIVEGEPAELLVLSQDDAFYNFKVSEGSEDTGGKGSTGMARDD